MLRLGLAQRTPGNAVAEHFQCFLQIPSNKYACIARLKLVLERKKLSGPCHSLNQDSDIHSSQGRLDLRL